MICGEEMKRILIGALILFLFTSCNGWFFQPSGYNPPTPFLHATQTPSIFTATPGMSNAASQTPIVASPIVVTNTPEIIVTNTPFGPQTETSTPEATALVSAPSVSVEVLGCNTSIDITHGMGEVTNAFVTMTNTGNIDLTNLKATLFALDEGRAHPDKTAEIPLLPIAQRVTVKLTVDSTYKADTPIQVEVSAAGGLFQRNGESSCKDIGIFAPDPVSLKTPIPVNP